MNLLLLSDADFVAADRVRLVGRRAQHAREVLRAQSGEVLRVGQRGGMVGEGEVLSVTDEAIELRVTLTRPPPARPGIDLLLAMPRPKQLKRVLPAVASLGVDRVVLVNAARVEKSYFDSKVVTSEWIDALLELGLEQARDTVMPHVQLEMRFRPFVEDRLKETFGSSSRCVLHPLEGPALGALKPSPNERLVLAIGPEGGWVPFELDLLGQHGFVPATLGERILRVEVCVSFALGQLSAR